MDREEPRVEATTGTHAEACNLETAPSKRTEPKTASLIEELHYKIIDELNQTHASILSLAFEWQAAFDSHRDAILATRVATTHRDNVCQKLQDSMKHARRLSRVVCQKYMAPG